MRTSRTSSSLAFVATLVLASAVDARAQQYKKTDLVSDLPGAVSTKEPLPDRHRRQERQLRPARRADAGVPPVIPRRRQPRIVR